MSRNRLFNNFGFTLTEMVISSGLSLLLVSGLVYLLSVYSDLQKAMLNKSSVKSVHELIEDSLNRDCSWSNTVQDVLNASMTCLRDGSNCSGQSGSILKLRDTTNTLVLDNTAATSGFDPNGNDCNTFDEDDGNDECPLRIDLEWQAMCSGSCETPQVEISANYKFRPKTRTVGGNINESRESFKIYRNDALIMRNCKALLDAGHTTSGLYLVDPDLAGGTCPFEVYCDMTTDGGGWALIMNAPRANYPSFSIVTPRLSTSNFGRLADDKISALLSAADTSGPNNIKVTVSNGSTLTVSMHNQGASTRGKYSADDLSCGAGYDAGPTNATFAAGANWEFFSGASGEIVGVSDISGAFLGFSCQACGSPILACTLGAGACCADYLEGSVWVR